MWPTVVADPIELTKSEYKEVKKWRTKQAKAKGANLADRTLGSIVPQSGSMCGDVYELPEGITGGLPTDFSFSDMDAVGALYTYTLNVPYQLLDAGLPGVTSRPEWFAIDYHGEFWVETPGVYNFRLTSDDGSKLYIDDQLLINVDGEHLPLTYGKSVTLAAGRHTINIPYYDGPRNVALILEVEPPGGTFQVFDLRDFAHPAEAQ
jgi:hypothetical protein